MLELRFIRENLDLVKEKCARRGMAVDKLDEFSRLDRKRLALLTEVEALKNKRNTASKEIAQLKGGPGKAMADPLILEMRETSQKIKDLDAELAGIQVRLQDSVMTIPNLCDDTVPVGQSDSDNVEVRKWGEKPAFSFTPKSHWELGEQLRILDFERAAKLSGARFSLLTGLASRLDRALTNFMLDLHTQRNGYTEVLPPFLVKSASMTATGQLPKFEADLFKIQDWDLYLIPTAEVPVTNIFRDETIDEKDLPVKFTAFTPCFRSEAGSYGKDTRGLIRQHQFTKVELVKFTTPETSTQELESLLATPNRSCSSWVSTTGWSPSVTATWAFLRRRPTTSRSGCRDSRPTGRSLPAPISSIFKPGAAPSAIVRRARKRAGWSTP